jgi:hypothetical protein
MSLVGLAQAFGFATISLLEKQLQSAAPFFTGFPSMM